jgi:hypothetical protein
VSAVHEKELYEAIVDIHLRLTEADLEMRVAWLNWIKTARRRIINAHNRLDSMPGERQLESYLPYSRAQASWEQLKDAYLAGHAELARAIGQYDAWQYSTPIDPEIGK